MENNTAMAKPEEQALTTEKPSALEALAKKQLDEIQKLNPEFSVDFMNVFTRMKLDTKGRFVYDLSGETFVLGDVINARLLVGEYMYQLWDSDDNLLVCYSKDHVANNDGELCIECPYNKDPEKPGPHPDCKIRYALALSLAMQGEDPDDVYLINIPSTGAFAFADYVKLLRKHKKGVADVITELRTEEKTSKEDSSRKYNAILFKMADDQAAARE